MAVAIEAGGKLVTMLAPISFVNLFRDPGMFESSQRWRKSGFEVEREGAQSDIMIAHHPAAKGYLFKRYSDKKVSLKDQLKNYRCRVEGAEKLRAFVAAHRLTAIAVPQKHLLELPPTFARRGVSSYVLVVDRLPILSVHETKQRYRQISDDTLRQLCMVLLAFRGLDSGPRNLPLTDRGQIAFIDTERWNAKKEKKAFLRRIREHLSHDQRKIAEALFKDR
jgi:hypothetical protein